MASDLREALEEIASESMTVTPQSDLWQRGRRRHRVRQAVAGVGILAVLAGFAGAWSALEDPSEDRTANEPGVRLSMPDRVWMPSPWTKGTDDAGPPGAVAVTFQAERRGWFGRGADLMLVSAVDGSYRFLDVPGELSGQGAPSPDGRYVLFRTFEDPVHDMVRSLHVYDAQTGQVTTRSFGKDVIASGSDTLRWLDNETVLLDLCQVADVDRSGYSCSGLPYQIWNVRTGVVESPATRSFDPYALHAWGADVVVVGKTLRRLDPATGRTSVLFSGLRHDVPVANPSLTRFAVLHDPTPSSSGNGDDGQLQWASVPARGGVAAFHDTGLKGAGEIVGWVDDHTVAVTRFLLGQDRETGVFRVDAVDLQTGEASPLITFDRAFQGGQVSFAGGLADRPLSSGAEPGSVMDPRIRAGLAAGGLVLVVALALAFRARRRGPRWS